MNEGLLEVQSQKVECDNGHRATVASYLINGSGYFRVHCDCGAMWWPVSEPTTHAVQSKGGKFPPVPEVTPR